MKKNTVHKIVLQYVLQKSGNILSSIQYKLYIENVYKQSKLDHTFYKECAKLMSHWWTFIYWQRVKSVSSSSLDKIEN